MRRILREWLLCSASTKLRFITLFVLRTSGETFSRALSATTRLFHARHGYPSPFSFRFDSMIAAIMLVERNFPFGSFLAVICEPLVTDLSVPRLNDRDCQAITVNIGISRGTIEIYRRNSTFRFYVSGYLYFTIEHVMFGILVLLRFCS